MSNPSPTSTSRIRRRPRAALWCVGAGVLIAGFAPAMPAQTGGAAEPGITLEQALARAKQQRPLAEAARGAADRGRGSGRVAAVIPNPEANLQFDQQSPTRQLTLQQPLAWLVRRGADVTLRRALTERGVADSTGLMFDLQRDVQRTFYAALAAALSDSLSRAQAAQADSVVRLADRRVQAGDIAVLERDQIAQEALRARLVSMQAREAARVNQTEFARAVAWDEGTLPRAVGDMTDALTSGDANQSAAVTAGDVLLVPALRAAKSDSIAAAARLEAARMNRWPVPSIIAGVQWGSYNGIASAPQTNPILGVALPLPSFSRGGEAVQAARGAAIESAARAAEVRLGTQAQVRALQIRVAERSSRARLARDSLLPQAAALRSGAVRLYEAGRTGVLPVLDALRAERDVAQILVAELLAFQEARADLAALLGRQP